MSGRRRIIAQKRLVFLGCEGKSEAGYGALLSRIVRDTPDLNLHVHVQILQPGAGDPLQLVEKALRTIRDLESRWSSFGIRAVLLDVGAADKNKAAIAIARTGKIQHLIWQDPDHEAMLLRHLQNCQTKRPPRGATLAAIKREWPEYEKGMPAQQLARRIILENIRCACAVEADLRAFIAALKLLK